MAMDKEALGGGKTIPFIIAGVFGVGVGAYSIISNLSIYLIEKYNVQPVDATVIGNVVSGSSNLAPLVGAIFSDTCLSCFTIITVACAAASLAMLLFTLTAALPSLRPPPCSTNGQCQGPATWQLGVLYTATALMTVGLGGTRFTAATMGAAQFDDATHRDSFFSWYVVGLYISSIIGMTGVVYIQENVGWVLGFGLCAATAIIGLIIFLHGNRCYRQPKPLNNPFVDVFHSIVKRRRIESSESLLAYDKLEDGVVESQDATEFLSSPNLNGLTREETKENDLTILLRLTPLITTGIVLSLYDSVQMNITFLQALVLDCHLGPHFSIPVGSISIFLILAVTIFIPLLDHVVYPTCRSITGRTPSPLQRVGIGFFITTLSTVYGAMTEAKRLQSLQSSAEPMSVLWLVPLFVMVGLGTALHFPGQLAFFYHEFPETLKGSGTAVSAIQSGIGSFLTTAVIELVRRFSDGWIEDDANQSRLDKVYWMLALMGTVNLACFIVCARTYRRKKGREI